MNYILTLITKKSEAEPKAIGEIENFLKEKKGQLIETNKLNDLSLGSVFKIEVFIDPQEVAKLKKKIKGEREIISHLLEKKKEIKKIKEKAKKIKKAPAKTKPNKTRKVIASMQEEEKKIKDLDSTLDKILNE